MGLGEHSLVGPEGHAVQVVVVVPEEGNRPAQLGYPLEELSAVRDSDLLVPRGSVKQGYVLNHERDLQDRERAVSFTVVQEERQSRATSERRLVVGAQAGVHGKTRGGVDPRRHPHVVPKMVLPD